MTPPVCRNCDGGVPGATPWLALRGARQRADRKRGRRQALGLQRWPVTDLEAATGRDRGHRSVGVS